MAAHHHHRLRKQRGGRIASRGSIGRETDLDLSGVSNKVQALLYLQRTIGNQSTTNLLQRQEEEEEGSATVVGSTSETEGAADASSFTADVTGQRGEDATPTDEELSETLKKKSRQVHEVKQKKGFHTQHPSLAQLGIRPSEIKGKKLAAYVGNEKYKAEEWPNLPGAKADANRMKSTMKAHEYETIEHAKDKSAPEVESIISSAINKAKAGDALLLYYAGHGIPGGIAGVDSAVKGVVQKEEKQEGGDRGLVFVAAGQGPAEDKKISPYEGSYMGHTLTDIAKYTQLMGPLEAGVSKGIHTTFIADACHSGTATDLVRDKAVEKLAKTGGGDDKKVKAVTGQINRLKDMKNQIPGASSQGGEGRGGKLVGQPITLEADQREPAKAYWEDIVHPELVQIGAFLKGAGFDMTVPEKPGTYTKEGIEQQINAFINQLVDLGEAIKKEGKESILSKAT